MSPLKTTLIAEAVVVIAIIFMAAIIVNGHAAGTLAASWGN